MQLQGKVALVTGAATGIGTAIATRMAQEGASVVINYRTKPEVANAVVEDLRKAGGRVEAVQADVSIAEQVHAMVQQTVKVFGGLDIMVNNAGMEIKHPFVDFPLNEWQRILDVDLTGPFLCAQAAARQMISQKRGGRIINISSIHEDLPMLTNAPYCAAKGGLRMLMRTIAVELAPHQITVNNIGPGAIYTPIDADIQANPAIERQLMDEIPLRRWGQPEEVAGLAVFLASDAGSYCTGSTYFIDGGMLRQAGSL